MTLKALSAVLGLAVLGLIASPASFAGTKAQIDARTNAAIKHFYALNPANRALADKAAGMLVFAHVTKGGVGVAGEYGEGVLRVKDATVGYYSVASASVGLTIGIGKHSEIIMFMTEESLDKFRKSEGWSIGADTAIAIVQKGAGGQYDTATLGKPILGFVFGEKGLIGDLSLEGTKVSKIKSAK